MFKKWTMRFSTVDTTSYMRGQFMLPQLARLQSQQCKSFIDLHCRITLCRSIYGVKSTLKIRQVFIVHADAYEAGSLQGL